MGDLELASEEVWVKLRLAIPEAAARLYSVIHIPEEWRGRILIAHEMARLSHAKTILSSTEIWCYILPVALKQTLKNLEKLCGKLHLERHLKQIQGRKFQIRGPDHIKVCVFIHFQYNTLDLISSCWSEDPDKKPTPTDCMHRLEAMLCITGESTTVSLLTAGSTSTSKKPSAAKPQQNGKHRRSNSSSDTQTVKHHFNIVNSPRVVMCAMCSRLIIALKKRGVCTECGIFVHKKCISKAEAKLTCSGSGLVPDP